MPQSALADMASSLRCNVNLIRYNPVASLPNRQPSESAVESFAAKLSHRHVNVNVRRPRGLETEAHRQTYAMPVFRYAGVYLGLVMLLDTKTDLVDCELVDSNGEVIAVHALSREGAEELANGEMDARVTALEHAP